MEKAKKIAVLGSTGSIGRQTLDVMERLGLAPASLAARSSVALMEEQARRFLPNSVALLDEKAAADLRLRLADTPVRIFSGREGLIALAADNNDIVLSALVGIAGLMPTMAAIEAGSDIALANKETLVCAGRLVTEAARKKGVSILPVDSEHSAIFQCLEAGERKNEPKRIMLTASGGPFFGKNVKELEDVTPADALRHPNWSMGPKITVDSATLMNKGLELIEAVWLFGVRPEQIDIVIHRESIIHSLVEFKDNSVLAQLGYPDMRLPIQYALTYPERLPSPERQLELAELSRLTFARPDGEAFPCLPLAISAAKAGDGACVVLNGANEEAVARFLSGKLGFSDIPRAVAHALDIIPAKKEYSLEDIAEIDRAAREAAASFT